jgi:hypothetical protein
MVCEGSWRQAAGLPSNSVPVSTAHAKETCLISRRTACPASGAFTLEGLAAYREEYFELPGKPHRPCRSA